MTEIAVRLDSQSVLTEERDIRVDDFLNDKLQIGADLENLDSLLLNAKNQQILLRKQLVDAEVDLEKAERASESHASSVLQQADVFTRKQADIERKILIITRSETSDDAVHQFDSSMEKLRRLDIAQGYVELLAGVDKLSSNARRNFKVSPQAALQPYVQLQNLARAVKAAQPAAEGAAPHLVDYVEDSAAVLWKQMKDAFGAEFEETLAEMKWPGKDVTMLGDLEERWTEGVLKLLDLQEPELRSRESQETGGPHSEEPLVLLPLEVMVKPLELRFRYHFDGEKPTNRPDKPEYFLSHIIGLLNTYNDFLAMYLQPILSDHFKGSNLALNPIYIDSTSAFITSLLPMLRRKVLTLLPQIAHQPQLLSHLIHELMSFDTSLRDEWAYDGGYGLEAWKGLAWEVLVKRDWFGKWLQVEKDFALSRYQNILDAKDSGELDYDSVDPGNTKPTKAAIRVNDLLETITDRYRPLSSFSQKLRFLLDIQITIFDKFHDRLQSSLEAYLTLTSPIARTMQGIRQDEQMNVQGIEGLERLCRVYGSAEYMEKKMRDWSDDVFFLELWEELQDRARSNTSKNLAGPMSIEDVAERTSTHVGSEGDSGALFDETAGVYRRLRVRTEGIVQDSLIHDMRDALRPYGRINPWSSLSPDDSNPASLAITAELDAPLQQLTLYLTFLAGVLATAPLRRTARQLSLSMQTFFWENIMMRNTFSASGAAQLSRDLAALWGVLDKYLGPGQGAIGMKKLKEGVVLLNLPAHSGEDTNGGAVSLLEVEQKVFESNESAREVLHDLGLEVVSESEARHVLERRVELGT